MSWQISASLLCLVVVSTLAASTGPDHIGLTLGEESETHEVPCLQWKYYEVEVTEPCKDLNVVVKHQRGEPNVYVSRGNTRYPTESSLAWSSYEWGSEYLVISSWDPEFTVGTFYIGVHAYCGDDVDTGYTDARYTILVESVETDHPHEEISPNGIVADILDRESYKYFRFCMPDSCNNIEVKIGNCIDPVTCPNSYAWPELLVSRSIITPTINDHAWKLAAVERRSVVIDHNDPEFYPGHYYIGVYGWCTPDEQCNDVSSCGPCDNYQIFFNVSLVVNEVTSGCKPKQPLGLCEGGGASVKASLLVLILTSLITGFVFLL